MVVEMSSPENLGHQFDAIIGFNAMHELDGHRMAVHHADNGYRMDAWYSKEAPNNGGGRVHPFTDEQLTHPEVLHTLAKHGRLSEVDHAVFKQAFSGKLNIEEYEKAEKENKVSLRAKEAVNQAEEMLHVMSKHDKEVKSEQDNRLGVHDSADFDLPNCRKCNGGGYEYFSGGSKRCSSCGGSGVNFD